MERLLCNFHYLAYYCSPNLSIHQNSTQEPTWNFLVTLGSPSIGQNNMQWYVKVSIFEQIFYSSPDMRLK